MSCHSRIPFCSSGSKKIFLLQKRNFFLYGNVVKTRHIIFTCHWTVDILHFRSSILDLLAKRWYIFWPIDTGCIGPWGCFWRGHLHSHLLRCCTLGTAKCGREHQESPHPAQAGRPSLSLWMPFAAARDSRLAGPSPFNCCAMISLSLGTPIYCCTCFQCKCTLCSLNNLQLFHHEHWL